MNFPDSGKCCSKLHTKYSGGLRFDSVTGQKFTRTHFTVPCTYIHLHRCDTYGHANAQFPFADHPKAPVSPALCLRLQLEFIISRHRVCCSETNASINHNDVVAAKTGRWLLFTALIWRSQAAAAGSISIPQHLEN